MLSAPQRNCFVADALEFASSKPQKPHSVKSRPAAKAAGNNKHNRALARFPLPRRSPHGKGAAPKRSPSLGQCLSCLLQFIGWRCVGVWLQPVKIIGGLLRVAGGGEDGPLVVTCRFEDWEVHKRDMIDIGRGDFTT